MGVALLVLLFILLPLAGGLWVAILVLRGRDVLTRVLVGLAILTLGALGFNIAHAVAYGPSLDWNGAKLAPIIAMVRGNPTQPLYGDRDTGVMSAWIYGPVPALVFLPTALFDRPTGAILMGVAITIACSLPPALWIILRFARGRDAETWVVAALAAIAFTWVTLEHESLRRAMYMVGPDGPALGLLAGSCLFVMSRRTWFTTTGSVVCSVLACWCKQSLIPFLLVPPLFIFAADGFRNAVRYLMLLAPIGLVFSAILVISFNPANMFFQMVEVSANHQFQEKPWPTFFGKVVALWYGVGEWVSDSAEPLVLLATVLLLMWMTKPRGVSDESPREEWWPWAQRVAREYPWSILILAGVVLWPASILGYVKIGGYYNNFALTNYFLLIAACAALVHQWPTIRAGSPQLARLAVAASCVFVLSRSSDMVTGGALVRTAGHILHPAENAQETIYDFAKKHPGEGYFPWNVLSTLLAEGKLYHFEWGLVDRIEAGKTNPKLFPTPEQLRHHLPAKLNMIALPPIFQSWDSREPLFKQYIPAQYLPAYAQPPYWQELKGYAIWVNPEQYGFRVEQPAQQSAPQQQQPQQQQPQQQQPPAPRAPDPFDLTPRIR